MTSILVSLFLLILLLRAVAPKSAAQQKNSKSLSFLLLPSPSKEPARFAYEMYSIFYSIFWMSAFGAIVVFKLYEYFTANIYLVVLGGLAMGNLLQPVVFPQTFHNSPDARR